MNSSLTNTNLIIFSYSHQIRTLIFSSQTNINDLPNIILSNRILNYSVATLVKCLNLLQKDSHRSFEIAKVMLIEANIFLLVKDG